MGGMTVTEVDAGNIIVPPRKVNPIKDLNLNRADNDDIDEWSLDMTRGEYVS